jgi:hypothetical protein
VRLLSCTLSEEVPVAALFVAPDAGTDCAIYVRPKLREALYWLTPLDADAVIVAEYTSAGAERLLVMKSSNGQARA